ncbi:MAG: enoyl-[acyl-carrier-protein] reductase, partial [Verrucomicrobia bacterium]|nr:enoyl-[acyl-carrier-protein] reductase [Verrucomicrobiota bacterium]
MLQIDLKGKRALIAGIGDDQGFGWAIAKALADAGAEILIATWAPIVKIFSTSWSLGKFDESRKLKNGKLLEYSKLYPIDAIFDTMEDVPQDIRENKRYAGLSGYTVSEVAKQVEADFGKIDILVHSLANAPEVTKNLLDTSRKGYLAAMSSSAYSFISLLSHFGPIMNEGGSALSLSSIASERVVPGYGGGMSSAKAALESDTRTLA